MFGFFGPNRFAGFLARLSPFKAKPFPGQPFPPKPEPEAKPSPTASPERQPAPTFNEPFGLEAQVFGTDDVDRFVHFGSWFDNFTSSNVARMRYDQEQSQLTVEYKNGNQYSYQNVSIREAESFARGASKGKWVWDHLRVRGKGNFWAFRKPYQLIGVGGREPQWMRSAKARKIHGLIGPEGLKRRKILGFDIPNFLAPKWWGGGVAPK